MGPMIRVASLRGFVPLVEQLGGDADRLLDTFGIPPGLLTSDEGLVSLTAHDLMLDAAAAELDCPDFGLRLAEQQDLTILGPLAVAIQACSTAAQAVETTSRFLFVHSPALRIGIEPDPRGSRGVVALTYRKELHESPYSPQAMELGIGLFHRVAVALVGSASGIRSVELPHRPLSPVRRYTRFFGADVKFGAASAALRVQRRILDAAFGTANESIRQLALAHLADRYDDPGQRLSTQVRRALAESLGSGATTLGTVAQLLAVHPRTLQRRLAAEGLAFEAILDDVRRDAVHRYLTTTDMPLGQVAALVGFSEQSALSRAVRRWTGLSPRELRRASTAGTLSR